RERLFLERLVLGHGLDDEVTALEILEPGRTGNARQDLVLGLGLDLSPGGQPFHRVAQTAEPALAEIVFGLYEEHREAGLGRDLHDARAHETATDHTDVLDGHGRSAPGIYAISGDGRDAAAARKTRRPAGRRDGT